MLAERTHYHHHCRVGQTGVLSSSSHTCRGTCGFTSKTHELTPVGARVLARVATLRHLLCPRADAPEAERMPARKLVRVGQQIAHLSVADRALVRDVPHPRTRRAPARMRRLHADKIHDAARPVEGA
jgi:hypothetical protein